jgi:hypothetical protein
MDIIITIPKTVNWDEYLQEIKTVASGEQTMYFKVPNLPVKTNVGDRCYLCYCNRIIGYMRINFLGYIPKPGFTCTTTGAYWSEGRYIGRTGSIFWADEQQMDYKGFQGFRYAPVEWRYLKFNEMKFSTNKK